MSTRIRSDGDDGQSKRLAKRDKSRALGSSSIDTQIQTDRFSDWDKENVNIAGQVAISAPVPVWCTSLGKDALKTILAMGEEEENALTERLEAHIPQEEIMSRNVDDDCNAKGWGNPAPHTVSPSICYSKQNSAELKATMVIRPITPSTLIALTEPCLMEWCFTDDVNPVPNSCLTQKSHDHSQDQLYAQLQDDIHMDVSSGILNMWGY